MSELIGVISLTDYEGRPLSPTPSLKREALFFDRVAVPGLQPLIAHNDIEPCVRADLTWLAENGIVWDPKVDYSKLRRAPILRPYLPMMMMAFDVEANTRLWLESLGNEAVTLFASDAEMEQHYMIDLDPDTQMMVDLLQQAAASMNSGLGAGTVLVNDTIYEVQRHQPPEERPQMVPGIELVIDQFPAPDENTPWAAIQEFRADPDHTYHLRKFRSWLRRRAYEGLSGALVVEELQELLADFEHAMGLHRMKGSITSFQGLIVATASLIEDMAKLKLGDLSRRVFGARERRLAYLETELRAPGREVAYLAKAREHFGRS
jgi:hypothetical protein